MGSRPTERQRGRPGAPGTVRPRRRSGHAAATLAACSAAPARDGRVRRRRAARKAEGDDAVVAAERLGELRGLAVADAVGDLADRQPARGEQLGGALHAHRGQVLAERRVADLRVGALELAARRGDAAGDVVERQVGGVLRARRSRSRPRRGWCGGGWWRVAGWASTWIRRTRREDERPSVQTRDRARQDSLGRCRVGVAIAAAVVASAANEEATSEMQVRDGMSTVVLTVGPGHTLREAARLMAERKVGAAVVIDPDGAGPGDHHRARHPDLGRRGPGPRQREGRRPPDLRRRLRGARLVARGGRRRDGRAAFRHLIVIEGGEVDGHPLGARRRPLLDRRRRDVRRAAARPPRTAVALGARRAGPLRARVVLGRQLVDTRAAPRRSSDRGSRRMSTAPATTGPAERHAERARS